jgi:outer membrane receptor for ferrienterochelin and colicin
LRDDPSVYENNHIDKSWQADIRRHDNLSRNSTLFYGGEGIQESIDSNNLGDHDRSRGAVYLDYDVRALKRFSFSLGAREDILSASHGELSPTFAAGVWLKPGLKLKGSVSRAFGCPATPTSTTTTRRTLEILTCARSAPGTLREDCSGILVAASNPKSRFSSGAIAT